MEKRVIGIVMMTVESNAYGHRMTVPLVNEKGGSVYGNGFSFKEVQVPPAVPRSMELNKNCDYTMRYVP